MNLHVDNQSLVLSDVRPAFEVVRGICGLKLRLVIYYTEKYHLPHVEFSLDTDDVAGLKQAIQEFDALPKT